MAMPPCCDSMAVFNSSGGASVIALTIAPFFPARFTRIVPAFPFHDQRPFPLSLTGIGRAIGIVSQMAGAMVLSRAVSHVAHDRADELTEVNRANPGSWAAQKGRPPSVSSVN